MFSFLKKPKPETSPSKSGAVSNTSPQVDVNRLVDSLLSVPDAEVPTVEGELRALGPNVVNVLSNKAVQLARGAPKNSTSQIPLETQKKRLDAAMLQILNGLSTPEIVDIVRRDLKNNPTGLSERYAPRATDTAQKVLMGRGGEAVSNLVNALTIEREQDETRLFATNVLCEMRVNPPPEELIRTAIADPLWLCRYNTVKYLSTFAKDDMIGPLLIHNLPEEIRRMHKEGWSLERIEGTFYKLGGYERVLKNRNDPRAEKFYHWAVTSESYVREFIFRYVFPTLIGHSNEMVALEAKAFLVTVAKSSAADWATRQMAKDALKSIFGGEQADRLLAGSS